jgi:hypothetical protein
VRGSTKLTFKPVRLNLKASNVTDSAIAFTQTTDVSGCGTVSDQFRLERTANGDFSFSETAKAPCVSTYAITAQATRTLAGYLFAEPSTTVGFGSTYQGDAATRAVTLRNVGRLRATTLGVTGLAAPYSFADGTYPGTGATCGTQLAGLSSCTFAIALSTATLGNSTGSWAASYLDGVDTESEGGTISGSVIPKLLPNPTAISAGNDVTCAITNGNVVCWGDNGNVVEEEELEREPPPPQPGRRWTRRVGPWRHRRPSATRHSASRGRHSICGRR